MNSLIIVLIIKNSIYMYLYLYHFSASSPPSKCFLGDSSSQVDGLFLKLLL